MFQEQAPSCVLVFYEGAKPRSKSFVAKQIFSLETDGTDEGTLLREHFAGACFRTKLPRVYWSSKMTEIAKELVAGACFRGKLPRVYRP